MLCIHNNSLMLNHIFAFTLPEIQDVPKKGTFPDFDVPFPVTGTGMTKGKVDKKKTEKRTDKCQFRPYIHTYYIKTDIFLFFS